MDFFDTCANTRDVYLDVVSDCSSTECINALRRFISRFGVPSIILSDNGTSFVSKETQSFVLSKGTK